MLAALPMYDFPELRAATDALWNAIGTRLRDRGVAAPKTLERGQSLEKIWGDPNLLLGQTCGYPLVTSLAGKVFVLATPRYSAEGCEGAFYRSAIIVRQADPASSLTDLRGRRCAVNDAASNSGMNVLRAEIAALAPAAGPYFSAIVMTGAHVASAQAVAGGQADVAALDCVTWAHLQRLRPAAARALRVLCWTRASPGLPLITSLRTNAATRRLLLQSLEEAATDPALATLRAELLLDGFESLGARAYQQILDIEQGAAALGYPTLT